MRQQQVRRARTRRPAVDPADDAEQAASPAPRRTGPDVDPLLARIQELLCEP